MRASTTVFAALLLSLASPSRADPNEQRQRHLALRRQRRSGASDPELAARCEKSARSPPAECRRRAPCDLRVFDPGRAFHRDVILQSRPREWAKNNVDAPNRHFQNGVEWWVHRALPPPAGERNASALVGARRVFVAAYFSYMFIFAPHKVPAALSSIEAGLGAGWRRGGRNVVAHGHPGACVGGTSGAVRSAGGRLPVDRCLVDSGVASPGQVRLLVDDCSSCGGSRPYIAVPRRPPREASRRSCPRRVRDTSSRCRMSSRGQRGSWRPSLRRAATGPSSSSSEATCRASRSSRALCGGRCSRLSPASRTPSSRRRQRGRAPRPPLEPLTLAADRRVDLGGDGAAGRLVRAARRLPQKDAARHLLPLATRRPLPSSRRALEPSPPASPEARGRL